MNKKDSNPVRQWVSVGNTQGSERAEVRIPSVAAEEPLTKMYSLYVNLGKRDSKEIEQGNEGGGEVEPRELHGAGLFVFR